MKAIILAGGKGTRLMPLTKDVPKALISIGNKTLIQIVLDSLPDKIDEIIIVRKYLGNLLSEKIGEIYNNKSITYIDQEERNGTWSALFSTRKLIEENEKFLVLNCDDIFKKEDLDKLVEEKRNVMGISKAIMPASYYGIRLGENDSIDSFDKHTGQATPIEDWFSNGAYILDSNIFKLEPIEVYGGEFGLPQTLLKNKDIYPIFSHNLKYWQACNSFDDIKKIASEDAI